MALLDAMIAVGSLNQYAVGTMRGSPSYTGTATWHMSVAAGVAVAIYDQVRTFGGQLRSGIAAPFYAHMLTRSSGIDANLFATYYDGDFAEVEGEGV